MKHPKCRNPINSKCVPSSNRKSGSGSEARLCMQRPPSVRRPQSCALSSSSKVCCCCLLAAVLILVLPFFPLLLFLLLLLLLLLLLISDLAASAQLHPMPLRPSEHQVLSRVCKLLIFSDCTFILFLHFVRTFLWIEDMPTILVQTYFYLWITKYVILNTYFCLRIT